MYAAVHSRLRGVWGEGFKGADRDIVTCDFGSREGVWGMVGGVVCGLGQGKGVRVLGGWSRAG